MVFEAITDLFLSVLDILRGSIVPTIPVFLAVLFASWLRKKIEKETKRSWIATLLASTIIVMYFILLFAYFIPYLAALQQSNVGEIPSPFAPSLAGLVAGFVFGALWVFVVAVVASLILLPLEFVGAFIYEYVSKKLGKQPGWLKLLIATYISVAVASAAIIFIVPWLLPGFLYFLYYGIK
ncbi:MAG: hypothetical protein AABW99_03530 [archaeon]